MFCSVGRRDKDDKATQENAVQVYDSTEQVYSVGPKTL